MEKEVVALKSVNVDNIGSSVDEFGDNPPKEQPSKADLVDGGNGGEDVAIKDVMLQETQAGNGDEDFKGTTEEAVIPAIDDSKCCEDSALDTEREVIVDVETLAIVEELDNEVKVEPKQVKSLSEESNPGEIGEEKAETNADTPDLSAVTEASEVKYLDEEMLDSSTGRKERKSFEGKSVANRAGKVKDGLWERRRGKAPKPVNPGMSSLEEWKDFAKNSIDSQLYYCRDCREWSIIKEEDICPSCLIPVYNNSKPRDSSSTEGVGGSGVPTKLFSPSELPFGLKRLSRQPQDILETKAKMMKLGSEVQGEKLEKPFTFPPPSPLFKYPPPGYVMDPDSTVDRHHNMFDYSEFNRSRGGEASVVSSLTKLDPFDHGEYVPKLSDKSLTARDLENQWLKLGYDEGFIPRVVKSPTIVSSVDKRSSFIRGRVQGNSDVKAASMDQVHTRIAPSLRLKSWVIEKLKLFEKIDLLKKKLIAVSLIHKDKSTEEITSLQIPIFTSLKKIEEEMSELNGMKTNVALFVFDAVERDIHSTQAQKKPRKTHSVLELEIEKLKEDVEQLKLTKVFRSPMNSRQSAEFVPSPISVPTSPCFTSPPPTAKQHPSETAIREKDHVLQAGPLSQTPAAPPCMRFSNLYDIGAQIGSICKGDNGSKFVIGRLRHGAFSERRYAYVELRLPKNLIDVIASEGGRFVVATLMEVDTPARNELLRHIKNSLSHLLTIRNFREFFIVFIDNCKLAHSKNRHLEIRKLLGESTAVIMDRLKDVDGFLDELISKRPR